MRGADNGAPAFAPKSNGPPGTSPDCRLQAKPRSGRKAKAEKTGAQGTKTQAMAEKTEAKGTKTKAMVEKTEAQGTKTGAMAEKTEAKGTKTTT